jgi:hypothetical protein
MEFGGEANELKTNFILSNCKQMKCFIQFHRQRQ